MRSTSFRFAGQIFQMAIAGGPKFAHFAAPVEKVETIYDVAARQRKALRKREADTVRQIQGAWKVAARAIEARLKDVVAKIEAAQSSGQPVSAAWLYQQERYQAFLATIRLEIDRFAGESAGVASSAQAEAFSVGTSDAAALVGASGVRAGFIMLPKEAFTSMVGFLSDGSPLVELFAAMGDRAVASAREAFNAGMAAGDHPRKIAKALMGEIKMERTQALAIARTEVIRAYTTSQQRNYERNADVVVAGRITSSRDSRTCFLCLARDGTILEHGESFPRHVCCRCALLPVVKYLDKDRGTGEAWLRAQPEAVQREKLGPSRFALWKSGQVNLQDLFQVTNHSRWGNGLSAKNLAQVNEDLALNRRAPVQKTFVPGMGLSL